MLTGDFPPALQMADTKPLHAGGALVECLPQCQRRAPLLRRGMQSPRGAGKPDEGRCLLDILAPQHKGRMLHGCGCLEGTCVCLGLQAPHERNQWQASAAETSVLLSELLCLHAVLAECSHACTAAACWTSSLSDKGMTIIALCRHFQQATHSMQFLL